MKTIILTLTILIFLTNMNMAQETISLPKPKTEGGKPLMEVLKNRQSARTFQNKELLLQDISNILWAAYGINRENSNRRTVPSARNKQEFDIYLSLSRGLYLWNPIENTLFLVKKGDFRKEIGMQDFVATAPLILIYVANFDKMDGMDDDKRVFYSANDCGYICQNVYLYAASENLNTVVIGSVNKEKVSELLNLKKSQHVILAQPIGYPEN